MLLALFPLPHAAGRRLSGAGVSDHAIWSVGSLTAAAVEIIAGTVFFLLGQLPLAYALFIWVIALFVVYLHRENIQRLLAGTENRFTRLR
ncbi:MAG: hypothetical protein U0Z44_15535 [Kouleothrix sp.]